MLQYQMSIMVVEFVVEGRIVIAVLKCQVQSWSIFRKIECIKMNDILV